MSTRITFRASRSSALFTALACIVACSSERPEFDPTSTDDSSGSGTTSSGASSSNSSTNTTNFTSTASTSTGPTGSAVGPTGTSGPSGASSAGPSGSSGVGPSGSSGSSSVAPTSTSDSSSTSGGSGASTSSGEPTSGSGETSEDPGAVGAPNPSGLMEPGEGGKPRPSGAAGNLTVLPWAGYGGAVSYTFDDNEPSQYNNEDKLLDLGVPFTWYLWTDKGSAKEGFYKRALEAGHEIGNHTSNHPGQGQAGDANKAQSFIQSEFSVTAYTMAAPNGDVQFYNDITNQLFLLDRGVGGNPVGADEQFNKTNFPTTLPPGNGGAATMNPQIDSAASQGRWQTYCIHGFDGNGYQAISLNSFLEHIAYAKTKNIWIGTMVDVAAYHIGRRLVNAATPTTQGGDQVYTWTLPDVFPPGKYVRVTVDGGTLSQDGTPLSWNDHGFYEVALDAGELTLSP